ncbi:hypothetical protein QVD17_27623 [Tagetes erecta]|uniref:TIR domain-containing protein n=1 Tax=Tagetes erecta TaxID=13708 RepID=A0AAD8KBD3_TARER|nr:hypothetical protein QVD17_27623 [Tagetes erecta]
MDQRRRCKNFVLPVFYLVDPSDVRKQTGTFIIEGSKRTGVSKCFTCVKAEKKSVWTEENVKQWKEALTDVANLGGMELSSSMSETSFIAELVETVQCKLDSKQLSTPAFLIGVEARVQKINSLLKDEQYNAIAICGMGGSGKTTLAQHIYNLNKKDFKSSSFVDVSRKDPYVLRKGEGSYTIEGLALDIRKVEQGMPSKTPALETSSLENMGKLKLLQLKYVQLNGSYENFPNLIWLCWQGCPLKTVPSGLLVSSLVAIDMSDGDMEMFEAPTVLNSLKHLNLKGCDKLFGISNLYRLPKVESLILLNCSSLNHLCTSIGDLKNLYILDLGGCTKLWKYVNQILVNPENPLFSLPKSLMWLNLENNNLERTSNVCLSFHVQSSVNLTLSVNPFEYLPDNINLQTLHTLNLYSCPNLKSLSCIPSTLMELHIDWCTSLEKVTFHLGRFTLHEFSYEGCSKLSEIQGLFKLEPIAKTSEADLGHMHWIKAYEDHMVDLIGDDITKGRTWHTQILYEYGIMSTYLQGIKDQIMTTYEYTSSCSFLFFRVPCHHEKHRVEGLNISCIYRSSQPTNKDRWILLAKISNKTKGLTWIYNPVVYCKPNVDEDVVWLSYWPIGNVLDAGDEVHVEIIHEKENMIVSGCSVSFVYTDSEVERERNYTNNLIKDEEVIGGDLSGFEVTEGGYYLCRRDLFALETSLWLKQLFGDNIDYPVESVSAQRYRNSLSMDELYHSDSSSAVEAMVCGSVGVVSSVQWRTLATIRTLMGGF